MEFSFFKQNCALQTNLDFRKVLESPKKLFKLTIFLISNTNQRLFWCEYINNYPHNVSECRCEEGLYKYSHSGLVPLGKGDVVWSTNYWGRQFKVEFDIQAKL